MRIYLRVARPTDCLANVVDMYRRGLELEIVASFQGHAGYDGVVLARRGTAWEIEFTSEVGIPAPRAPSPEHLLVVYEEDRVLWESRCDCMAEAGFASVASANPYWDERGRTFEDPEGYRIVIQNDVAPGQRAAGGTGTAPSPDSTSEIG